ncbi:helix-turn-helix domain-containing protein [Micromonospora sp. URMC 106]|uniref:helix-turn-helix domain-containing protein n=1 Tax=Micromonospora sp. URMC 106 TaxID=3423408 RepID=UPI003F1E355B
MKSTSGVARNTVEQSREAAAARAIDYMRRHLSEPLQLADLARVVPFSPFHFHRLFRDVTTMTPARFLAALRMAEARRMLLHSGLTVTAISGHVGYTSAGTFTTQFSRLVGTSPGHFRQMSRLLAGRPCHALAGWLRHAAAEVTRPRLMLHVPGSAPGDLVLVGLRGDREATDAPTAWAVAAGGSPVRVATRPGPYQARVVLVRGDSTLTRALVDEEPTSHLVGTTDLVLPQDGYAVARVDAAPPRPTDPPALAIGPVCRLVERFMRLSGPAGRSGSAWTAGRTALATAAIA